MGVAQPSRLQCCHCWAPITFLSLAHLIFYVSVAQTLRCINGFKYQRRCHKLTLGLATEKLREFKMRIASGSSECGEVVGDEGELQIHYQEPPESYFGKFKRNWALHFGFLILIYAFMVEISNDWQAGPHFHSGGVGNLELPHYWEAIGFDYSSLLLQSPEILCLNEMGKPLGMQY
ncbi:hypothetical protein GH714_020528 [Hevea brasiliensis]|uniref:Uncharacterized protein n=1 Tax=Hevea brasiliensis TaxID=3981 RepID=A0A6A6K6K5_HEVBR|nr:hypothetical protein GH714_020528 [Hevea brasiliensis]